MSDLSNIPEAELRTDLAASLQGILVCSMALGSGVTHHKDGLSVSERLEGERKIVATIRAELERRGLPHAEGGKCACNTCAYPRDIVGSAHTRCGHPAITFLTGDPLMEIAALMGRAPSLLVPSAGLVEGHPTGISRGWFQWPLNFDPVWLVRCAFYTPADTEDRG